VHAARKPTVVASLSISLVAALALAGSAAGVRLPGKGDKQAPSAPTNVSVTSATPTTISLAWDPSTDKAGVSGYYVYIEAVRAVASSTKYTATNLACGTSVRVWIVAFDRSMNRSTEGAATVSTAACPDGRAPTPPLGFRQAATTQDSAIVQWTRSADDTGVVAYGIYRNQIPVQSESQPTTTLTGLTCSSTLEFQVDAVDAAGNRSARRSVWVQAAPCNPSSSPLQQSLDASAPSPPTALSFDSVTESDLSLTWTPSADDVGVVGYDVYRNGTKMATVTSTSYTQGGLLCDSSYWFGVEALDAAGNRSERIRANPTTAPCAFSGDKVAPTQPANLAVRSVTQTRVALTWSPSADNVGVVGYDAYRNGKKIVSVFSTSLTHGGLRCGTSYWFGVAARDISGNRSERARVPATTAPCAPPPPSPPTVPPPPSPEDPAADKTAPTQPSSLALESVTRTSVALTWSPSTDNVGVSSYRVYVNGAPVSDPTLPGATVTALVCGTAFTFEVDASDAAGNRSTRARVTASTSPCADTQAPTAPRDVAASSRTATSIALTWTASTDNVGVTGYGLYRGGTSTGASSTTTGIFSGLTCNTNYTLAIDAQDAAGNRSLKTTVLVATAVCPDTAPPSAPTGFAASNVTQSSLTVTWIASTDNVGVVAYDVYRNGTKMDSTSSMSSSQSGLACGTSYWFGVEAYDAAGNRSARVNVGATTSACPPPPPPPSPPPSSPPPPPSNEPGPIAGLGYSKTFGDEFSTPLDTNVWSMGIWYNPAVPAGDIYTQSGLLNLVSHRGQGYPERHITTDRFNATGIPTNILSFRRGYFEARMKFTSGRGVYPQFWLFNTHWRTDSSCPPLVSELDIFEGFPSGPNTRVHSGALHRNTTGPCGAPDEFNSNNWTGDVGYDLTADFHTYSALWTANEVIWYLDGRELKRWPVYDSTDQDMMLLLGMTGHTAPWLAPDASSPGTFRLEVDWVRVWQK